jgi:hypothetical protein
MWEGGEDNDKHSHGEMTLPHGWYQKVTISAQRGKMTISKQSEKKSPYQSQRKMTTVDQKSLPIFPDFLHVLSKFLKKS